MTSISFWGFAAILATTLRITWEFFRIKSKREAARVASTFSQIHQSLFQFNSKLVIVAVVSGLIVLLLHISSFSTLFSFTFTAFLVGAFTIATSNFLNQTIHSHSHLIPILKSLRPFFGEKSAFSLGTIFLGSLGILFVFLHYSSSLQWDTYLVLDLLSAYIFGGSIITLLLQETTAANNDYVKNAENSLVSADRLDILMGVVLATALLGTTFTNLEAFSSQVSGLGAVILPIILALLGSFISSSSATFMKDTQAKHPYFIFIEKFAITLLLILTSYYCITTLLPETWVAGGKEFSRIQVFYAAQAGLITGLITSKLIYAYDIMEKKFVHYLYNKAFRISILDRALHTGFRVFYGIAPLLLLIGAILLAYDLVGLYGVCITIVAMLSNFRTELSAEIAELEKLISSKIVEILK